MPPPPESEVAFFSENTTMSEDINGQPHDRSALFLYGSETGNSQDVAEDLGRLAERLRFETRVCEMDAVEINILLKHSVVVFVISTTGQGEFPKNARKFWKSLLRKRLPPGCLDHVSFTTFGLGDSSYPKFNWSARKLHKRLEQLGAKEIYPRGEADEQHEEGVDGTFLSWSADFRAHLLASFPLPEGMEPIPADVLLPPKYKLEIINDDQDPENLQGLNRRDASQAKFTLNKGRVSGSGSHSLPSQNDSNDSKRPSLDQAESGTALKMSACGAPFTNSTCASPALKAPAMMTQTATHLTETTGCAQLKEETPGESAPVDEDLPQSQMLAIPRAIEMKLISNKRLTPDTHWQDVRELSFYMSEEFTYYPGDTVTIYPKNFPTDVQALIDLMEWNTVADVRLRFVPEAPDFYHDKFLMTTLPKVLHHLEGSTLRDLLIHNLDITAIPKRYFFELVAHYCSDTTHKERLQEFSNPIYTDEFFDYTSRPRRSILEVLQDFPSVKIPFIHVATIFPLIRGRQYSIASGGPMRNSVDVKGQKKVQILVAIVKYRTVLKKIRQGLCSRYLASLPEGSILNIGLERNESFYYKARLEPYRPLLLIAPGTGLAPARSLIWERALVAFKDNTTVGNNYLFFGGRNKSADYFYKEEWTYPSLRTKVFTAFSRDQREKIYVQDIIRQNGKLIADLLDGNSIIYICGSSGNMPKAVRGALIDAMHQFHPLAMKQTKEGIEDTFKVLEKQGRFIQETW